MSIRPIKTKSTARPAMEGAGVHLHRVFGFGDTKPFDPFLMMDDFRNDHPSQYKKGFPWHPHRGIETITYVLKGTVAHADSLGNFGDLSDGDIQWMTAGSGVVHSEMPEKEFIKKGGKLHGFQLWVNLPKKDKMIEPRYQEIPSKTIPFATSNDGKVSVKVIAGESMGKNSVIETKIPITYLHFIIQPGGKFSQKIPIDYNSFAYVSDGEGLFGLEKNIVRKEQAVFFERDGDEIVIENDSVSKSPLNFLLLGGMPIGEPVARYGPFVMNTDEEVQLAVKDYQAGKMGKIDF